MTMQVFEIRTTESDCPYLVIAAGFKNAIDILCKNGICDSDIVSVRQQEIYKSGNILIDDALTARNVIEEQVRRELQANMPQWKQMHGAAGGGDRDVFLIRTGKGFYSTSKSTGCGLYYLVLEELEQLPGLPKEE